MAEIKEVNTYFGRCRCCMSYGYLKDMWSQHLWNGEIEVYGEMLVDCFALTWDHDDDKEHSEQDQICNSCIPLLRIACNFKKKVLESQELIINEFEEEISEDDKLNIKIEEIEQPDEQVGVEFLEEEICEEIVEKQYEEVEFLENVDAEVVFLKDEEVPQEETHIEYLEEDEDSTYFPATTDGDDDENKLETRRMRKKRILKRKNQKEANTDEEESNKPKWPKRLPKHERNKTYKQYTEEDMRNCLEAIRKNELSLNDAAEFFKIPKKTLKSKLQQKPQDGQKDKTTKKSADKCKLQLHKKNQPNVLQRKPTIFRNAYFVDDATKKLIKQKKKNANMMLNTKNTEFEIIKKETHDKMANVIDFEIKPELEASDDPVDANQIRTRYKALVNNKFNKKDNIDDKSDNKEMNKHKDNIKSILQNSNATLMKGFWGTGYSCYFCKEQRELPSQLKEHNLEVHINEVKDAVKVKYVSDLILRIDITNLKCKLCENNIDSLEELLEHLITEHSKLIHRDVKNHIIPFKFDSNSILQCVKCKKEFKYFKLLSEHMNDHYRNYECPVCERPFINKQSMQTHSYRHNSGNFKCSQCPKVFDSKPKKSVHERVIHALSNKTRKCGYCEERFSTKDLVLSHEVKVHGIEPTVFSCQACNKCYNSQSSLMTHRKRFHLMLRPHKCAFCDMAFFSRIELRSHTVTHTKSKDFKCEMCSKSFGTRCSLNQHVRGHLDDRRFKCENCERTFVHRTAWRVHMRSRHVQIV